MTEPATPRPIILRRLQLSTAAWQLLSETAAAALQLPQAPEHVETPWTEDSAAAAWTELHELGLSPAAGEVRWQWLGAVALLLAAPLTVTARATYNGVSTTSALGLRGARGIAVHQRHLSESTGSGTVVTGSEDSVEVTLFDEEKLWPALERLLPPLEAVRAPAKAAPLSATPAAVLGAATDLGALPEPAASLVAGEDANVTLSVTAAPEGQPARLWTAMWSVAGGHLYSVRTRNTQAPAAQAGDMPEVTVTEVPAGHIAHELVFAVVGAHDALAGAGAVAGP
ncbi:hypothetical protein CVV68_04045 [Arthrobacter livingstonensis]|uniref:Uncharacterized protein n=1 Tax=Arthrobacter livingstonensis TaxID=670078 RepID=A0A2V5LBU2_9MICC|nr:hypothetical protein [Arthrobacter livingstonensis]PYI68979.1 hypothetical protein CVV68_04045 [Arthrobacter livingstonensis]